MTLLMVDPTYAPDSTPDSAGASPLPVAESSLVMLWNTKPNGDELLEGIRNRLHAQLGRDDIGFAAKATASMAAPPELLDELAGRYQSAVVALADCGSCSSYCLHDAVELERRGVATAVIVTTVFEKLVLAHARSAGISPRLIVLDHPVGGLRGDALEARVEQAYHGLLAVSDVQEVGR